MNDNIKLIISKNQLYHALLTIIIIFLGFFGGYVLGKKWGRSHQVQGGVEAVKSDDYFSQNSSQYKTNSVPNGDPSKDQVLYKKVEIVEKSVNSNSVASLPDLGSTSTTSSQNFVASRNGTKFYPAGCKSADRIKTENRVYFSTKDEAIRAGLEEATSC